ncbi:MAG: hypothetical protein M5U05_14175 [Anaerolineales bacterium]|nr:hypothetical protein [Anaerolineales bacterium]
MGSLKYKILRDLWVNKVRTLQVMLIIGIGSAAIGMILGTRNLIVPGMQEIWMRMNPAMINIFVYPPISEDDLITLAHTPGVAEIEGFSSASIEWKLKPEDEWRTGGLTARNDYRDQNMNKLELLEGGWPRSPRRRQRAGRARLWHPRRRRGDAAGKPPRIPSSDPRQGLRPTHQPRHFWRNRSILRQPRLL